MLPNPDEHPVAYIKLLVIMIPGLVATLGLVNGELSIWSLLGIILLVFFIAVGWVTSHRQLPDWSLMASGILLGVAQPVILGIIGVFAALITNTTPSPTSSPVVTILPWIGIALILFFLWRRGQSVTKVVFLVGMITFCCILVRVKYFILFGVSWSILGQMLGISLWAAGTLLLPVMFVGLMPRRFGELTILFAVGATFVWYQVLIDNGYKVSTNMGNPGMLWVYYLVVSSLFIVIGPCVFLRLVGLQRKLLGLIVSMCTSVVINILVSGIVRGDFTPIIWLSAIPYTVSIGLSPLLAYWLYRNVNYPTENSKRVAS
jgi:hypothetical protein